MTRCSRGCSRCFAEEEPTAAAAAAAETFSCPFSSLSSLLFPLYSLSYREWGWAAFRAWRKFSRVRGGSGTAAVGADRRRRRRRASDGKHRASSSSLDSVLEVPPSPARRDGVVLGRRDAQERERERRVFLFNFLFENSRVALLPLRRRSPPPTFFSPLLAKAAGEKDRRRRRRR